MVRVFLSDVSIGCPQCALLTQGLHFRQEIQSYVCTHFGRNPRFDREQHWAEIGDIWQTFGRHLADIGQMLGKYWADIWNT